jgi:4a-hydroxytetrahydrobiopterin dehydratase
MAKLAEAAVRRRLAGAKGWRLADGALEKQFTFSDFKEAMFFVNSVAGLAERAGHHPDMSVVYNRVTLRLSTHDAGGITAKDFDLAKGIEAVL